MPLVAYYRPQRSCSKVMFLHVSVILFTGGVFVRETPQTDPPGQRPSWTVTPPDGKPSPDRDPQTETPWTETPGQRPLRTERTGGMHRTGMHSCCFHRRLSVILFTCVCVWGGGIQGGRVSPGGMS